MADDRTYVDILNKARRKRKRNTYRNYIGLVAAAAVLVVAVALMIHFTGGESGENDPAAVNASAEAGQENPSEAVETLSEEELAARKAAEEKQAVVDSYQNLGLVQLENGGYLNIRETPDTSGKIIGSLMENSACEIVGTEGDWSHITSGGVEGYISNRYVLTGDEARQKALEYVTEMAIVNTEKLNIRQEPNQDSNANVVGQALIWERYPVLEQLDGWIRIEEGYISADYVILQQALNEGRKLDLKTMALNQYDHLVISKVDNYLNIRKEMNTSDMGNVIGKFPSRAAGEILETLDGWYKIKSGPITGYITADPQYVAVGQEARDLAMEAASLTAIVNTDMLNVRAEPNTDAKIWTQISKEERYSVLNQLDGWVEIELDTGDSGNGESSDKAYISTRDNNVEVRYALTEAIKFSPLEERANQQASLRSKVVNYGLQFVGGRYVWGGNDPHTGADCSGFVKYILKNIAGVNLPRTSREQAKVGKSVSSGEMRPGDLIFYTGSNGVVNHVAMYIGNGQIVHAASKRSGIKISTWNYRKPKTIRNVLD